MRSLGLSSFRGSSRFEIQGQLGEGGMGIVYRAFDRVLGYSVALKTMSNVSPDALLLFKNEFRTLADIAHPNLVQLFDFFTVDDQRFFTMELIDGIDFLAWVRGACFRVTDQHPERPAATNTTISFGRRRAFGSHEPELESIAMEPTDRTEKQTPELIDVALLRSALVQLADGIGAIHNAGKLHGDIKPSNILVTNSGRPIILDFGIASDYRTEARSLLPYHLRGTPHYFAPEQAYGPSQPASDWYALGTLLYQILTGEFPFHGTPLQFLLRTKNESDPSPPSDLVEGLPSDLESLCLDLLSRKPEDRPNASDIHRRLQSTETASIPSVHRRALSDFVGRESQTHALEFALTASESAPVIAALHGRSGMGKSTIVRRFLDSLREKRDIFVFSGRCYERESMPYKGLDSVVDQLAEWLATLSGDEREDVLPPGFDALANLFPVLQSIVHQPITARPKVASVQAQRRQAFTALKDLLRNASKVRRLVIFIDDWHWSDRDSADLLVDLVSQPDPVQGLFVLSYRDELAQRSAAVLRVQESARASHQTVQFHDVFVDALSMDERIALVDSLDQSIPAPVRQAVTTESQGVPYFIDELLGWHARHQELSDDHSSEIALDQILIERVHDLDDQARALLEVLTVAGRPILVDLAFAIARINAVPVELNRTLRTARLIQTHPSEKGELLEPFHDRLREAVIAALPPEKKQFWHERIADALKDVHDVDPEMLLEHFLGAGNIAGAREQVMRAAAAAERSFAFVRAARLYETALHLKAGIAISELHRLRADALANAGRASEAATAYLEAANTATDEERGHLRRLAAEYFLKGGDGVEGIALLRTVVEDEGLSFPNTVGAVAEMLWLRARLRIGGLPKENSQNRTVDARERARIETAFTAASGLSVVDLPRAGLFASRYLRLALNAGEPLHTCRALALEAGNISAVDARVSAWTQRLVRESQNIAARLQDPHATGLSRLAAGFVNYFHGEWSLAIENLYSAEQIFREECHGAAWEMTLCHAFGATSLLMSGRPGESARRSLAVVREARERGDKFELIQMKMLEVHSMLNLGQVDQAEDAFNENTGLDTYGGFAAGHINRLMGGGDLLRYQGRGREAWKQSMDAMPRIRASHANRVRAIRVFLNYHLGRCAIAAVDDGHPDKKNLIATAKRLGRQLEREPVLHAPGLGLQVVGCAFAAEGDDDSALATFRAAAKRFEEGGMPGLVLGMGYIIGKIIGGDEGKKMVADCMAFTAREGLSPDLRSFNIMAPGCGRYDAR